MHRSCPLLLVALVSGTQAKWLLSTYSLPTTDSAKARAMYGVEVLRNPSSAARVEVSGGAVRLVASRIASDSTAGLSARVGIQQSIVPERASVDLLGLQSVEFEFRNSATITDYLGVSFGSEVYSKEISKAGTVYEVAVGRNALLAASGDWKKVSLPMDDFATPKWWTDIPADFPPNMDSVLRKATSLRFEPKTAYSDSGSYQGSECTRCVTPTMDSLTLEIRNIVLVGVDKHPLPNPERIGCSGTSTVLDWTFDDSENEAGGYWFNYSDFDSLGTSTDQAKGSSRSALELAKGDEYATGFVTLKAELDKMVGGQWHWDAGWAVIGTGFEGAGWFIPVGLTGIGFRLQLDSLSGKVDGIRFKVGLKDVSDTATHSVMIPAAALEEAGAAGLEVCIRPEDLRMPGHVSPDDTVNFAEAMVMGVKQLAWEAKIADRWDSTLTRANVQFAVGQVVLYGYEYDPCEWGCIGAVQPRSPSHPFSIAYANGALNLRGLQGVSRIAILSLDGRRVADFALSSRVPLRLSRGTWILAAHRRDGTVATQPFVVSGP